MYKVKMQSLQLRKLYLLSYEYFGVKSEGKNIFY